MLNPQCPESEVRPVALSTHERQAVLKRLAHLEIALGHRRLTALQWSRLNREWEVLQHKLALFSGE